MRFLLLDADVVIALHELGIWDRLIAEHEVTLASTVLRDEALYYYQSGTGSKVFLNLESELCAGKIREVSAEAGELASIRRKLRNGPVVDAGELESLAVLVRGEEPYRLCSANEHAIEALVLLDRGEQGISMEKMLDCCGKHRRVPDQYSEKRFRIYLKKASIRRLQNT